jgi:hypothetical protein
LDSFDDALNYALTLARSAHPVKFEALASKALCPFEEIRNNEKHGCYKEQYHRHMFIEGSLDRVLAWRPSLWAIPDETELSAMESLLTEHRHDLSLAHVFEHGME